MELIEPEHASEQGALPEPEPRYQTASLPVEKTEHGQAWVRLFGLAVLAIILIVLIVLFARWVYHKAHNHTGPSAPTTSQSSPVTSNNSPVTPAPSAASNSSNSSSSNSNNSSSNGSSNSSSPNQITNTGPGNVAVIFVGASLAAAGLHYLISVRRFAKNS